MNDQPKSTFARRVRAARARARKYEIRDDIVIGLGLTIQPSGVRTFFFARMVHGRRRFSTIGSADVLTIPEARREARRLIASYIEPARTDGGPRTPGHPMTAFAEEFLERHGRYWKPRTVETNSRVVHKNILPAFGHMTVDALTDDDVKRWFASLGERPGIANRAMPVLSVMMRMAELWGYRAHNTNPCKRTRRYRMKPRERFLTAEEMARLNAVLTRDEFWCPHIVLRLHDLRHSWASVAAMNGVGMVTVAKLLGHALVDTTERYVHLSDRSVAEAADRVSGRIGAALAGRGTGREGGCDHADG